jgi:hypothetical protein
MLEPTIYSTQDEHVNQYIPDAVVQNMCTSLICVNSLDNDETRATQSVAYPLT